MLFESTKTLLQSILLGLETGDESRWEDDIESGNTCLFEMHQMSGPLHRAYRTDSLNTGFASQSGIHERLSRAMQHVRSMVIAIRHRDRETALQSGTCALVEMNGVRPVPSSVSASGRAPADKGPSRAPRPQGAAAGRGVRTLAAGRSSTPNRKAGRVGRPS